mgnify:CR=1 FL=1
MASDLVGFALCLASAFISCASPERSLSVGTAPSSSADAITIRRLLVDSATRGLDPVLAPRLREHLDDWYARLGDDEILRATKAATQGRFGATLAESATTEVERSYAEIISAQEQGDEQRASEAFTLLKSLLGGPPEAALSVQDQHPAIEGEPMTPLSDATTEDAGGTDDGGQVASQGADRSGRTPMVMYQSYDEFTGVTWMCHLSMPILSPYASLGWLRFKPDDPSTHSTYLALYFGLKDAIATPTELRMRVQYYGDDWVFANAITIKADANIFEMPSLVFRRDHSSSSVWEWTDEEVSDYAMLRSIANAKRVVVRFHGQQYVHDWVLPAAQQAIMRDVLEEWNARGGAVSR